MKNILVTTLGHSSAIIPELFGFTNPTNFPLYCNTKKWEEIKDSRDRNGIQPIDELWVVSTDKIGALNDIFSWATNLSTCVIVRAWAPSGIRELDSSSECHYMADLIFRVVLHAWHQAGSGAVYLSLAGGRKTMSADMQEAAHFFGCTALLHVISGNRPPLLDDVIDFKRSSFAAGGISPIVIAGEIRQSALVSVTPLLKTEDYLLPPCPECKMVSVPVQRDLYDEIKRRINNSRNLLFNFVTDMSVDHAQTSFRALYALPPDVVSELRSTMIGSNLSLKEQEIEWLKEIPKAELHCHLGGILSTEDMLTVAAQVCRDFENLLAVSVDFTNWLCRVKKMVEAEDLDALHAIVPDTKELRRKFSTVPEPYCVAAFIHSFLGHDDLLEQFVFGKFCELESYCSVGIKTYESLGDLQGSGLLQCESALRAACAILKKQVREQNIIYLELRCSPVNYTRGNLTAEGVVDILLEELASDSQCHFMLIFIASRHGEMEVIQKHIQLATSLLPKKSLFSTHFAGFDLAGAESAKNPAELRAEFMPLLRHCINMTIHAGENERVKNIWEAVYHLSADRIGHGLTLVEDERLLKRFVNRKICLEMCPSSNFQIVGYKDFLRLPGPSDKIYPLSFYLQEGLSVTVNTDNPGISRTNLSHEFHKAATMTEGGLSKWQILQVVRNGFRHAFCDFSLRRRLMLRAETTLIKLLRNKTNVLG